MRTLEEAVGAILEDDYRERNRDLMKEITEHPKVLALALVLRDLHQCTEGQRLLQAISMGVAIGMEMEKSAS